MGSHPHSSLEVTGASVLNFVTGPQACTSTMLVGNPSRHLINRGRTKNREAENALACGQLLNAVCGEGCSGCIEGTQSFWSPVWHSVPWEGQS